MILFFVEIESVLFWNSHNDAQYTYNCNFQNHSYNFLTFISIFLYATKNVGGGGGGGHFWYFIEYLEAGPSLMLRAW